LVEAVLASVPGYAIVEPASGKAMRHALHKMQPELVIADEEAGDFRMMSELVRANLVDSAPRLIALLQSVTRRKIRIAGMVGCFDVIDLGRETWPSTLQASARLALDRPRSLPRRVRKAGA